MHLRSETFGTKTKIGCELNFDATPWLAIKDGSPRHAAVEHFFKAKSLGAKLYEVAVGGLPFPTLILDGKGLSAKLDYIGTAGQTKPAAGQQETAHGAEIVAADLTREIGTFVEQPAFCGEPVFYPCLLKMNEGPLPWTEGQMLQAAQRQGIGGHIGFG